MVAWPHDLGQKSRAVTESSLWTESKEEGREGKRKRDTERDSEDLQIHVPRNLLPPTMPYFLTFPEPSEISLSSGDQSSNIYAFEAMGGNTFYTWTVRTNDSVSRGFIERNQAGGWWSTKPPGWYHLSALWLGLCRPLQASATNCSGNRLAEWSISGVISQEGIHSGGNQA